MCVPRDSGDLHAPVAVAAFPAGPLPTAAKHGERHAIGHALREPCQHAERFALQGRDMFRRDGPPHVLHGYCSIVLREESPGTFSLFSTSQAREASVA